MADNFDGKKSMNPVLEESFPGDGTIVGGIFPPGEIDPIDMENSLNRNDEGIVVFPTGEINPIEQDDGTVTNFPAAGINIPIDQHDSSSSSRDDGIVVVFPGAGMKPIVQDDSSSMDEGIVGVFPPEGINIPINMEDSSSSSFSMDDGIIAIFPAGGTEGTNWVPVPDDCSAAGNKSPIVIIPGGNDGEPEISIGKEHSTSEDSSLPADDNIITGPGVVPETRIEPTKKGISKGSPGATQ